MINIGFVVFRECIEISIIMGVISASLSFIKNFRHYLFFGIFIGLMVAYAFSRFTTSIAESLSGVGEEVFLCFLLFITIVLIIMTVVMMKDYSRKLKNSINRVIRHNGKYNNQKNTSLGDLYSKDSGNYLVDRSPLKAFGIVSLISVSMSREFIEIIIFVRAISATIKVNLYELIISCCIGGIFGFLVGFLIYRGMLKISIKYIFKIMNFFLSILAAGLASEIARILISTGIVSTLKEKVFDASNFISNSSATGKILRTFIGYNSRPSWLEILFYFSVLAFIVIYNNIHTLYGKNTVKDTILNKK